MKLPNLDEARIRTKNEIEHIHLEQEYDKNTFAGQKYFLRTYGCQMNVHDGEEIAARLESLGFTSTEELEQAEIILEKETEFYEYTFDITNNGSKKAKLNSLNIEVKNPKNILVYSINYLDNKEIKKERILQKTSAFQKIL